MTILHCYVVFNLLLFHVWIRVAVTQDDIGTNDLNQQIVRLQIFLTRNGYMSVTGSDNSQRLTQAIIDLQTTIGLDPTGVADELLLAAMDSPRCGLADRSPQDYRTAEVRFEHHNLTYWIKEFPPFMTVEDVRDAVRDSFQVWADVTPLTFEEVFSPDADIQILFGSGDHGDGTPFDGRGGVLAHAYLPPRGDAHFDADETWTIGTFIGTNLFQVAAHEFGHSLGLFHSEDVNALMFPYYRGYQTNFQLSEDDKEGIRSLYGREVTIPDGGDSDDDTGGNEGDETTTPMVPASPQLPPPEACLRNGTFGSVVNTKDGSTYGFIDAYVWRLDVYPRTYAIIHEVWPGLPNSVQAAVQQDNVTYILKGCFAWIYENQDYFGRVRVQDQWPGLPCNVQAGYVSPSDGYTYFFKGLFVYRFHGNTFSYRRRIWSLNWQNLPARNLRITSANPIINSRGEETASVYFFTGNIYYLFDDAEKAFVYPRSYPREVNRFILDACPSS